MFVIVLVVSCIWLGFVLGGLRSKPLSATAVLTLLTTYPDAWVAVDFLDGTAYIAGVPERPTVKPIVVMQLLAHNKLKLMYNHNTWASYRA